MHVGLIIVGQLHLMQHERHFTPHGIGAKEYRTVPLPLISSRQTAADSNLDPQGTTNVMVSLGRFPGGSVKKAERGPAALYAEPRKKTMSFTTAY